MCGMLLAAAGIFCPCGKADNLLANPGFEETAGVEPVRWKAFVMPMEGAEARLCGEAPFEGRFAAMLHNPQPYSKEPANNWSQNIIADLAGKELRVRGYIKTIEATEAAIWLQCCTMRPFQVLHFATSSTDTPRYGTSDWAPVEFRVKAPDGAEFVILRCVLKGRGTAWFDSLSVEVEQDTLPRAAGPEDIEEPAASVPAASSVIPPVEPAPVVPSERVASRPEETGKQALQDLIDSNRTLQEEIEALRAQIRMLQALLPTAASAWGAEPVGDSSMIERRAPSLVPHGVDWRELGL